jgi:hypothetical protein
VFYLTSPAWPLKGKINTTKEAQDLINHLREEKRVSKHNMMKYFKECRPAIDNICEGLSNVGSKLKRNAALLRQV